MIHLAVYKLVECEACYIFENIIDSTQVLETLRVQATSGLI